jgi:hypothetical protein
MRGGDRSLTAACAANTLIVAGYGIRHQNDNASAPGERRPAMRDKHVVRQQ